MSGYSKNKSVTVTLEIAGTVSVAQRLVLIRMVRGGQLFKDNPTPQYRLNSVSGDERAVSRATIGSLLRKRLIYLADNFGGNLKYGLTPLGVTTAVMWL